MREVYFIRCKKYKEIKNPKISYICYKTLCLSSTSIYNKFGSEDEQILMEVESIVILKILGLINNIDEYQKIYNNV